MPFKNRSDAGRKLAKALAGYKEQQPVILALPRGGVTVAAEVAAVRSQGWELIAWTGRQVYCRSLKLPDKGGFRDRAI